MLKRVSTLLAILPFLASVVIAQEFKVPVEYYKLDNGLKVVLSQDKTAPVVCVAVYFNIGFRIEPQDRTGFAHLFEHMMFQGSKNLGKMEYIRLVSENGGVLNGSTRFDFTNYFTIVPSHKLETMLWAEADRMKGLDITQENLVNQQGVVINEVKVNVLNRPYGGFPWLEMPQVANENWFNAHNFYGDLKDLEAANLEDVKSFFDTYYSPNNAALVIVGDFEIAEAKEFIKKYFASIPAGNLPALPDISEPEQKEMKLKVKEDALATEPAIAFAYHMPESFTPEFFAMGIIEQLLVQGKDSRLYQKFVQELGLTDNVYGGINSGLGNMFNYNGPMLFDAYFFYSGEDKTQELIKIFDETVSELSTNLITQEELDRAIIKLRSSFYDLAGSQFGLGRADLLACFSLFYDNPALINTLEDSFKKVTPELIKATAAKYLQKKNLTVLTIDPKGKN
ncbi:MAG: insulinase family protein [Ignavibacteriaceae bacterium]|nr:insulinase family protein [Ignavibacteriaceae bacterium]